MTTDESITSLREAGMSDQKIAKACHVTRACIFRIRKGTRRASPLLADTLAKLARRKGKKPDPQPDEAP